MAGNYFKGTKGARLGVFAKGNSVSRLDASAKGTKGARLGASAKGTSFPTCVFAKVCHYICYLQFYKTAKNISILRKPMVCIRPLLFYPTGGIIRASRRETSCGGLERPALLTESTSQDSRTNCPPLVYSRSELESSLNII
jgi:hypothetical protein